MSQNSQDDILADLTDDLFATPDLSGVMPKFKIPQTSKEPRDAYQIVHDELILDGNARQNLTTFCQTWLDDEIHKIMDKCITKNLIDKDEYPQTAELERRCVNMIADLWNSPAATNTIGTATIGSSEAAMLGGLAMKWRWRQKRQKEGKPTDKPNLVCGPVQVCWLKFARYWDIELREVPLEPNSLVMTPEEAVKRCDENTIGVVPTLGITYTCQYEDVQAISAALDKLQQDTGLDIPIHVDAASGGFLAPFCQPDLLWDFRLPRVKSINSSGHKFGLAPLGVGWVVWREKKDLPQDLIFEVNYLGGIMPTFALNFSRPGGQIAAQYYLFLRLGKEGYRLVQQTCYDTAAYLVNGIEKMGLFDIIYDGKGGIPAMSFALKKDVNPGFNLYDLSDRIRIRGWQIAAYSLPPNRQDLVIMRILVRHGFSKDLADLLLDDLNRCIAYFKTHPVRVPGDADNSAGYNHN